MKIPYTKNNGNKATANLESLRLRPNEVKVLDMKEAERLNNVSLAGIEIFYSGDKGSVIASAQSVGRSRNQVFRTLLWDVLAHKSGTGGYPFYIEGTSSTKAYIKNATDREQDYVSFLMYGDNQMYMIGLKKLAPRETVEIDVKKIRDEQIPDEEGRTLPADITAGQIQWTVKPKEENDEKPIPDQLGMVGQMEQFDTAKAINSSYFCEQCCVGTHRGGRVSASATDVVYGDVTNIEYKAYETEETCYFIPYEHLRDAHWVSNDSSIIEVGSNTTSTMNATIRGAGYTQVYADWRAAFAYVIPCGPGGPYFAQIGYYQGKNDDNCEPDGRRRRGPNVSEYETNNSVSISMFEPPCGSCRYQQFPVVYGKYIVVKPKIQIMRDGTDITGMTQNVIVGQQMSLSAMVSGGNPSTQQWTIPPKAIKDYVVICNVDSSGDCLDPTSGTEVPLTDLSNSTVDYYWVDGGEGRQVNYSATVKGAQNSAIATFNVKRPTGTISGQIFGTPNVATINGSFGLWFGKTDPPPPVPGIVFTRFYDDSKWLFRRFSMGANLEQTTQTKTEWNVVSFTRFWTRFRLSL